MFECLSSRISCLQRWLHRNNQKHFDAQMLLHTNAFTHKRFYAQTLWDTPTSKTHKQTQFLILEPRFVRKGCRRTNQTRKKPSGFNRETVEPEPWNREPWNCGNREPYIPSNKERI